MEFLNIYIYIYIFGTKIMLKEIAKHPIKKIKNK